MYSNIKHIQNAVYRRLITANSPISINRYPLVKYSSNKSYFTCLFWGTGTDTQAKNTHTQPSEYYMQGVPPFIFF